MFFRVSCRAGIGLASSFALLALAGCGGGATDKLPRMAVSGSVTLDGKPLESGTISFDPDESIREHPVSGGAMISNGSYSIARDSGLTPGAYRVSIVSGSTASPADQAPGMPPKPSKEVIPDKFNAKTTLKAELTESGSTRFDYPLTSR